MLEIVSSPVYFLIYVTVVFLLVWLLLVRLFPLSDTMWKKTDYVWLSFALVGVLPIVEEARLIVHKFPVEMEVSYARSSFHVVKDKLLDFEMIHCRHFVRSEFSPDNFDKIVEEYKAACNWKDEALTDFPSWNPSDPPMLTDLDNSIPDLSAIERDYDRLREYISGYHDQREVMLDALQKLEESWIRPLVLVLSPFFLGFAIALRFAKVAGEIRNSSYRQESAPHNRSNSRVSS